jgi:type II secretory pathway pseudopilin PulG
VRNHRRHSGVSVVELIIAIVILGLIAALTIPRFSRAGQGTTEDELRHRLSVLRTAIELYRTDHGDYPGMIDGQVAEDGPEVFVAQLAGRTRADGRPCQGETSGCFGPYIRDGLPRSPFEKGSGTGRVFIWTDTTEPRASDAIDADWLFDCRTGYLIANDAGTDADGKRFDQY